MGMTVYEARVNNCYLVTPTLRLSPRCGTYKLLIKKSWLDTSLCVECAATYEFNFLYDSRRREIPVRDNFYRLQCEDDWFDRVRDVGRHHNWIRLSENGHRVAEPTLADRITDNPGGRLSLASRIEVSSSLASRISERKAAPIAERILTDRHTIIRDHTPAKSVKAVSIDQSRVEGAEEAKVIRRREISSTLPDTPWTNAPTSEVATARCDAASAERAESSTYPVKREKGYNSVGEPRQLTDEEAAKKVQEVEDRIFLSIPPRLAAQEEPRQTKIRLESAADDHHTGQKDTDESAVPANDLSRMPPAVVAMEDNRVQDTLITTCNRNGLLSSPVGTERKPCKVEHEDTIVIMDTESENSHDDCLRNRDLSQKTKQACRLSQKRGAEEDDDDVDSLEVYRHRKWEGAKRLRYLEQRIERRDLKIALLQAEIKLKERDEQILRLRQQKEATQTVPHPHTPSRCMKPNYSGTRSSASEVGRPGGVHFDWPPTPKSASASPHFESESAFPKQSQSVRSSGPSLPPPKMQDRNLERKF